jgi:DNA-binding transcriptional LysR family regulator
VLTCLLTSCYQSADGNTSLGRLVAAGFGVAVISEPLQKIPAKNVVFRNLAPKDRAWVPVGAAWKPDGLTATVSSQFVDVLAQACGGGIGGVGPPGIKLKPPGSRQV